MDSVDYENGKVSGYSQGAGRVCMYVYVLLLLLHYKIEALMVKQKSSVKHSGRISSQVSKYILGMMKYFHARSTAE